MSFINREFFEIAEETRRRETAVTLETQSTKKMGDKREKKTL